jgi:pimeloyl-ACP methyl ester carboxylesterase
MTTVQVERVRHGSGSKGSRPMRIYAVALALAVAGTAWPGAASAQMTLLSVQENAAGLDPARAEGAAVWSHGRSVEVEDSTAPTPGYVLTMASAGWDTYRLNRPRKDDTLPNSGAALADVAGRLKKAGYRKVVLAGHSFGGMVSLIAAGQSDEVDAVIATAPAAWGNAITDGDIYHLNATRLYEFLANVRRARVALAFFEGDIFDPGGRGARSEAILSARRLPHLVIDRPAQLVSHWASSTAEFTRRFSSCLTAFAGAVSRLADNCDAGQEQRIAGLR